MLLCMSVMLGNIDHSREAGALGVDALTLRLSDPKEP